MADARAPGARVTGTERAELAAELGRRYAAGETVRVIAQDTGRSFGFVHGLLKEAGVALRTRGGPTRGLAARAPESATTPHPAPQVKPDKKRKSRKVKGGKAKDSGPNKGKAKGAKIEDGMVKDSKVKDSKVKDGKAKGGKAKGGKAKRAKATKGGR